MPDIKIDIPDSIKAVRKIIPNTLQAMDQVAAGLIQLGGFPILYSREYADYLLKSTQQKLSKRLETIPEEHLKPLPPYMALPLMQNAFTYAVPGCEYLHDMFINLLASSMDTQKDPSIHPAFISIIKNLSPTDAQVLNSDPIKKGLVFNTYEIRLQKYSKDLFDSDLFNQGIPPIFQLSGKGKPIMQHFAIINQLLTSIDKASLNRVSATIDSLLMQGLLTINQEQFLTDSKYYTKDLPILKEVKNMLESTCNLTSSDNGEEILYCPRYTCLTTFGKNFLTCVT